jgi:hypothetical protein
MLAVGIPQEHGGRGPTNGPLVYQERGRGAIHAGVVRHGTQEARRDCRAASTRLVDTACGEAGMDAEQIKALGCWASDIYQRYLRYTVTSNGTCTWPGCSSERRTTSATTPVAHPRREAPGTPRVHRPHFASRAPSLPPSADGPMAPHAATPASQVLGPRALVSLGSELLLSESRVAHGQQ